MKILTVVTYWSGEAYFLLLFTCIFYTFYKWHYKTLVIKKKKKGNDLKILCLKKKKESPNMTNWLLTTSELYITTENNLPLIN